MPARFLTPLRVEKIGERTWLLTDDLVFESVRYPGRVVAPRGLQTNFASVPRVLWAIAPPVGNYDKAAVIHDGGYGNALVTERGEPVFTVKAVADAWFFEGMEAEGVGPWTARSMYAAVRLFGNPDGHPLRRDGTRVYAAASRVTGVCP